VRLFLHLSGRTLTAFLGALAGVVAIFLAVDFVDNSAAFTGEGWLLGVLELYANKTAVVVRQVAPAAMILGAALSVSGLRRTREWTAMRSLGLGPWRVALPVVAVALLAGGVLLVAHDLWGVEAADRAEEIEALRFGRGSDKRRYEAAREPKRWFRGRDGRHVYHLRGTLPEGGFARVTVLELRRDFSLARRIDAARMHPASGGWQLEDVEDRTFLPGGEVRLERAAERNYAFPEPPDAFAIRPGRASQMRWNTLLAQLKLRQRLGLPTAEFRIERYDRLAYPLTGLPGALLALALALRRERKGHVSAALVESVGVTILFWGAQAVSFALALSGRVEPWVAAWAPNVVFLAVGLVAARRVG
jgi:lipopolysaccharide export system permease protein